MEESFFHWILLSRYLPTFSPDEVYRSGYQSIVSVAGAAFGGGKWGERPRPRSWEGPALQAYEFVKLFIHSFISIQP